MIRCVMLAALWLSACSQSEPRLVDPTQIVDDAIPLPLSDLPSDAGRGERIFAARDQGHCVLCHVVQGLEAEFQGNVGPDLTFVAGMGAGFGRP